MTTDERQKAALAVLRERVEIVATGYDTCCEQWYSHVKGVFENEYSDTYEGHEQALKDTLDALTEYVALVARAEAPYADEIQQEHAAHSCYWPRAYWDEAKEAAMCPLHQRQELAEAELAVRTAAVLGEEGT